MAKSTDRRLLSAAVAAFCLALAVRGAAAWYSGAAQPNEIRYVTIARGILNGQGYSGLDKRFPDIIQPPLFPMMLVGALITGCPELDVSRGVSALMGSLLVFPVAFLTQRLFGGKAARRAPFLIAFYPLLVHTSSAALTESTFALLVLTGVLALWRAFDVEEARRRWILILVSGGLLGASFLTRPEGLAFLAVAGLVLVVAVRHQTVAWSAVLRSGGCLLAGFAIVLLPYLLWIHGKTGHWMLAPKAMLAWVHNSLILEGQREGWKEPFGSSIYNERVKFGLYKDNSAIRSQELFAAASGAPLAGILDNDDPGIDLIKPRAMLSLLTGNLLKLYDSMKGGYVIPPLLLVLAGIGLTSRPWTGSFGRSALIAITFFLGSLSFLLTFYMPRYLYSAVCFGLPWVAAGWHQA
ncbi:MAG TPA: glycosyltransferase family 39 protein, partial [Patescibacteria group bacterium]|nr:glycosyltransferase family 39 protein [Patescibacteria group bacterium]